MLLCSECKKRFSSKQSLWRHRRFNCKVTQNDLANYNPGYTEGLLQEMDSGVKSSGEISDHHVDDDDRESSPDEGIGYTNVASIGCKSLEVDPHTTVLPRAAESKDNLRECDVFGEKADQKPKIRRKKYAASTSDESESGSNSYDAESGSDDTESGSGDSCSPMTDGESCIEDIDEDYASFIRWPPSKRYCFRRLWHHVGKGCKVKEYRRWLKHIASADGQTVIINIKHVSHSQLDALSEIALNMYEYNVFIKKNDVKYFDRYRKHIGLIADKEVSDKVKITTLVCLGPHFVKRLVEVIFPVLDRYS